MKFPCLAVLASGVLALAILTPVAPALAQPLARACLAAPESLNAVAANRLIRPVIAVRTAAASTGAEAVAAKLCRWQEKYVYEIVLLHHDGRIANVFVDAASGAILKSRAD